MGFIRWYSQDVPATHRQGESCVSYGEFHLCISFLLCMKGGLGGMVVAYLFYEYKCMT
jgi:hypothetical protein